jgi:hypothetical protein
MSTPNRMPVSTRLQQGFSFLLIPWVPFMGRIRFHTRSFFCLTNLCELTA